MSRKRGGNDLNVEQRDEKPDAHDGESKDARRRRQLGGERIVVCSLAPTETRVPCPRRDGAHGVSAFRRTLDRPRPSPTGRGAVAQQRRRRRRAGSRTGTRCTILVKLPVAFSGGSTLNCAPVAGARLATWPWKISPGSTSAVDGDRLARAHRGELALLEVGVDPQALGRHDRHELRADGRIGAGARAAIADGAVDRRAQSPCSRD